MSEALFLSGSDAYQVSHIVYASPVSAIPEERRKGESTHSFKIVTGLGTEYCRFKSEDTAKNARGALGAMLQAGGKSTFRHGHHIIDASKIVSFSRIVGLKNERQDEATHAVVVTVDTTDEKARKVWLTYRSEDNAAKGRRALFAAVHAANKGKVETRETVTAEAFTAEPVAVAATCEESLPF